MSEFISALWLFCAAHSSWAPMIVAAFALASIATIAAALSTLVHSFSEVK